MINPQRLSKLIMIKEVKSSQDWLLNLYESTNEEERLKIKSDMENIRKERK